MKSQLFKLVEEKFFNIAQSLKIAWFLISQMIQINHKRQLSDFKLNKNSVKSA